MSILYTGSNCIAVLLIHWKELMFPCNLYIIFIIRSRCWEILEWFLLLIHKGELFWFSIEKNYIFWLGNVSKIKNSSKCFSSTNKKYLKNPAAMIARFKAISNAQNRSFFVKLQQKIDKKLQFNLCFTDTQIILKNVFIK